jgi:hypothetical protein
LAQYNNDPFDGGLLQAVPRFLFVFSLPLLTQAAYSKKRPVTIFHKTDTYNDCQKYAPVDLANLSKVIASEAKQSLRFSKRLLRRYTPRNDSVAEHIFDNCCKTAFSRLGRDLKYI